MVELLPITSDRITKLFASGIQTSLYSVLVCGLIGIAISKLINIMKG